MSDSFALFYARVWFAGKIPFAPGTCGSLVAIILAPFIFMPLAPWLRVVALALIFWSGVIASKRASEILGKKDPSEVVIDEVLGQWMVCLPFSSLSFWGYIAAFALFRLFDIKKPAHVKQAEELPGGYGIMLDDLVAGIYAIPCLGILVWLFG